MQWHSLTQWSPPWNNDNIKEISQYSWHCWQSLSSKDLEFEPSLNWSISHKQENDQNRHQRNWIYRQLPDHIWQWDSLIHMWSPENPTATSVAISQNGQDWIKDDQLPQLSPQLSSNSGQTRESHIFLPKQNNHIRCPSDIYPLSSSQQPTSWCFPLFSL